MESHNGMILTGETETPGKNPVQCHFVYYKSHAD
jgi:hypothetical protein